MVKQKGRWICLQDRAPRERNIQFGSHDPVGHFGEIEVALIFLLPPRQWCDLYDFQTHGELNEVGVAFRAVMDDIESQPPLTHDYSRSMTKRTKKIVQDGCAHLKRQRQAFAACLQTAVNESQDSEVVDWFNTPTRPLLAIVPKGHDWIKSINNAHIIEVDDWIHGAYPHGDYIRAISEKNENTRLGFSFSIFSEIARMKSPCGYAP